MMATLACLFLRKLSLGHGFAMWGNWEKSGKFWSNGYGRYASKKRK